MKRIAHVVRTASHHQPRCHARRRNPAFDSLHRRISTTRFRPAANKSSSQDKSDASQATDDAPATTAAADRDTSWGEMPLGGWDGRHLPKSMPDGWKEKIAEYAGDDEVEGEEAFRSVPKDEMTGDEVQYFEFMRMQQDELEKAARLDPRLRAQLDDFEDDAAGEQPRESLADGFWAEGEERGEEGADDEWENDDITSIAHAELEQHRELRELARAAVWDMPLLWKHRQEFKPPTAEQVLRFRYTTYLGEVHPAASKVVVDFKPSAFPELTPVQVSKLIKLLGVRYNPSTERAKMSCERFSTAAQNKRYLGDLVERLITEAKDPTDTFEDVPFDFRHHRPRGKLEFPEQWKMTAQRRAELQATWSARDDAEVQAADEGRLIQGSAVIQQLKAPAEQRAREARTREFEEVKVPAGRGRARPRY